MKLLKENKQKIEFLISEWDLMKMKMNRNKSSISYPKQFKVGKLNFQLRNMKKEQIKLRIILKIMKLLKEMILKMLRNKQKKED